MGFLKNFIKIVGSIAMFIAISSIGAYDYRILAIVAVLIYSLLLLKIKDKDKLINYWILLTPIIIIEGIVRILNFEGTIFSLPPFVFKLIPFILFIIFKSERNKKIAYATALILTIILNIFFYDNWLNYNNYGTFTGKTSLKESFNFSLIDYTQKHDTIRINENSQIKVIDFWTESCRVCYKKFPKLKELKDGYAVNKNIKFITALNANKLNFRDVAYKIDSTYNFTTYIVNDTVCAQLKIDSYPTILVFKGDNILFRGSVEMLKIYLDSEEFQNELPE